MPNYLQKKNIIPHIVFEILKFKKSCNLIGGEHLAYNLRSRFSSDIQFSYSQYGELFKAKK